jgi:hypothetical protein
VLFHHDSSAAPQTLQVASPVCGTKNFVSVRSYSSDNCSHSRNMRLGLSIFQLTILPHPNPEIAPYETDGSV